MLTFNSAVTLNARSVVYKVSLQALKILKDCQLSVNRIRLSSFGCLLG
jgi:hypothetical protein